MVIGLVVFLVILGLALFYRLKFRLFFLAQGLQANPTFLL